ncbi:extracellular solute-binding protein [Streptomyces sp. NPDC000987]|uniref:ABC transporter substrate-binding protein n=1 Tax=Streptomyces sp. NPDC000987 TaxID=3154374 RepID=UPI00331ED0A0
MPPFRPSRPLALGAAALALCLAAGACTLSDNDSAKRITLTVDLFGSFGFKEAGLYDEYMKAHPNIVIKESGTPDEGRYWENLGTRLDSGTGLADVQGLSADRLAGVVRRRAGSFTDLRTVGLAAADQGLLPWKSAAATAGDGKVLAVGTDSGPEAICYRTDLLKAAGLPTRRDKLAAKWSTWDGYLALGRKYAAKAGPGHAWTDSAESLFTAEMGQQRVRYTDEHGKPVHAENPAVRTAWKHAARLVEDRLTAKAPQSSAKWNKALSSGGFATVICPAWMLDRIETRAGDRYAGRWDVAPAPGRAGNVGGSYLAIPSTSKHPEEAAALVGWLTAEQQQVRLFTRRGLFPSSQGAQAQVRLAQDPYFNNAPVGEIFTQAAAGTAVWVSGADDTAVQQEFDDELRAMESAGISRETGWKRALAGADKIVGSH